MRSRSQNKWLDRRFHNTNSICNQLILIEGGILNKDVSESKKRVITDDSCAFDEIDQASGIAMNYQAELPEEEKYTYSHKTASNLEDIESRKVNALKTELNCRRKYNTSFWQKVESVLNPILLCKTKRQKDRMKMHHNAETTYYAELD